MQQTVDAGAENPGVVLKDAIEHFQPVFCELPGTVKVIFAIFLLLPLIFIGRQVHFAASGGAEQRVDLAL